MKVKELIEELSTVDQELKIDVMGEGSCSNIEIIDYSGTPELKPNDNVVLITGE